METSLFIARILATIYLTIGLGFLISGDYYRKELGKMVDNSAFMILGGVMAIVIGCLIIRVHNTWAMDWTIIITIMGWVALLKGVAFLIFPKSVTLFKPMLKARNFHYLWILLLALGLVFGYFGFLA